MKNNGVNTTEPKEVTVQDLVAAFEGKYISVNAPDQYGVTISINKATLECGDEDSNLWLVLRDEKDYVTGTICIDEDSIESIEDYGDGSYTVNFNLYMTSVDISEYKSLQELEKEHVRKNLKVIK